MFVLYLSGVVSVHDVLGDAPVEEDGFLGHDAQLGTQPRDVERGQILSIESLQKASIRPCLANFFTPKFRAVVFAASLHEKKVSSAAAWTPQGLGFHFQHQQQQKQQRLYYYTTQQLSILPSRYQEIALGKTFPLGEARDWRCVVVVARTARRRRRWLFGDAAAVVHCLRNRDEQQRMQAKLRRRHGKLKRW